MRAPRRPSQAPIAAFLFLGLSLPAGASPALSGSTAVELGGLALRSDLPSELVSDWYCLNSATLRLALAEGDAKFFGELRGSHDARSGGFELELSEAWYEWRWRPCLRADEGAGPGLGFRAGRSPLAFGPCLAFGPANPYVAKDAFDARGADLGLDGLFLELLAPFGPASREALPSLALRAAYLLPTPTLLSRLGATSPAAAPDLLDGKLHGSLLLFAPGRGAFGAWELGAAADLLELRPGGIGADWSAGSWISTELGGFVLGAEGALRGEDWGGALTANRRMGDYFALLEADYESAGAAWRLFARLTRAAEETELSLSVLADPVAWEARSALEASWSATDSLVFSARLGWNSAPAAWGLAYEWLAGLALECFF